MAWFNSEPVREFRRGILGGDRISPCARCYVEEDHQGDSRRIRSNQKSVIFTKSAFTDSYLQSPGYRHFEHSRDNQGHANTFPVDLHIDLGNFCNLACKMCNARASSTIASHRVKWGIESDRKYLGQDWTQDQAVWDRFKQDLLVIPRLNNLHFMGGETLLTDRLEDLVDFFIANDHLDLCLSFVTNGTVFRADLIDKLKRFRRVGLEISIECLTAHNAYVRQGTDTQQVLDNIQKYQQWCDGSSITVTLRPAPSALTIGYIPTLLEYALENKFIVKGNVCHDPRFLDARILPTEIKHLYQPRFDRILSGLANEDISGDFNASDPNQYRRTIKNYAAMCVSLLSAPAPEDQDRLLADMISHCRRWDQVYKLDARQLYPEWKDLLERHGY